VGIFLDAGHFFLILPHKFPQYTYFPAITRLKKESLLTVLENRVAPHVSSSTSDSTSCDLTTFEPRS